MPMPVRHLPVIQNWDCQGCTDCCREYNVPVTDAERERIRKQGWADRPEFAGVPLFVPASRRGDYRLNHRPDGRCVFLDDAGRCRIHAEFGGHTKPLACRVYPFQLVPAGDHWRVGLRFACPAVARNDGRPVRDHTAAVRGFAAELEQQVSAAGRPPGPPPLHGRQAVSWADLDQFVRALAQVLGQSGEPIERRLRKCLALAALCRQAKFDKLSGGRLAEFLDLVVNALDGEVPAGAADVPPPSGIGRLLFRQILVLYVRKDTGQYRGRASRSRYTLLKAALGFARGAGPVPPVNALLPDITFEQLEQPAGPLPAEAERVLERYFLTKVHSLQFTEATNFQMAFWDGFESLALSFPIAMWLSRALAHLPRTDAVVRALRVADDSFAFHPLLGTGRQRFSQRILSFRDEIPRLVAWYSR